MAQIKLYFDLMSQPSRTVFMLLKLNQVPFEACAVALRKGEHMTEEYRKNVNPFGLVPVLHDDDFKLTESMAISKYLIGKFNLPDKWFPKSDLRRQARVEEYLQWHHLNTRLNASMLMQSKVIIPLAKGKPPIEEKVDRWRKGAGKTLKSIESYFLKDQDYLAGNEISLADLFGACELMQIVGCAEQKVFEQSPIVQAWMERVKAETNPHFDEAHKFIYSTSKMVESVLQNLKQT